MNRLPLIALVVSFSLGKAAEPAKIELAKEGSALVPIVIAAGAAERTKVAADELADYLGRITGGKFEVKTGDGSSGIVVGVTADFPGISKDEWLTDKAITARENYLVRSENGRLLLIGNQQPGVEHAVWDLLHHLGHRQYFPGAHWEIVPKLADLSVEVGRFERPAFHSRSIWFGYGAIAERKADYEAWCRRNRATKGIELSTGHVYDKILHDHKAEFEQHPEWLALVGGKRQGAKFCIANEELRKLVVADLLKKLDADPTLDSVSCEPSDGGGWCECAECAKIGSVSDQALLLSNEVARAVAAKHPGKFVGQYAYNEHSPAPSIPAEPNVVVSIAAGFIKGGYTMDQLIDGWSEKASVLGIREYLSVHPWDRDMPAQARAAKLGYVQETIPHYHEKGARFYSAESSDNWGCNGLGYYLAARLLWNPEEAENTEAIFDDFLDQCFGLAKLPMTRFYRLINRSQPPVSDDLIGRMYRLLKDAGDTEIDAGVRSRLDDLVLYTRACELWMDYSAAKGDERLRAMEAMLRHAWRIRATGMIHTIGLWRDAPARDKTVKLPPDCTWLIPEGKNPWKAGAPFTREEINDFIERGIANRQIADFEPATFSSDLVPTTKLKLTTQKPGDFGSLQRGTGHYWTWIDHAPAEIRVKLTAGLVYQNQGNAKVRLYPVAETLGQSVSEGEAPPDKQPHEIILKTTFTGLHRIEVEDRRAGSKLELQSGLAQTFNATFDQTADLHGRHTLYFYVPKGTSIVGGFAEGPGRLADGSSKMVHEFQGKPGYFSVRVGAGEDGKLWKFEFTSARRVLLTVPPQMARSAEELLLPKEVVEKDAR